MSSDPSNDLPRAWQARERSVLWSAMMSTAEANRELARIEERLWLILAQHEPVNTLGLDREKLRTVLDYILIGRIEPGLAAKMKRGETQQSPGESQS